MAGKHFREGPAESSQWWSGAAARREEAQKQAQKDGVDRRTFLIRGAAVLASVAGGALLMESNNRDGYGTAAYGGPRDREREIN